MAEVAEAVMENRIRGSKSDRGASHNFSALYACLHPGGGLVALHESLGGMSCSTEREKVNYVPL